MCYVKYLNNKYKCNIHILGICINIYYLEKILNSCLQTLFSFTLFNSVVTKMNSTIIYSIRFAFILFS